MMLEVIFCIWYENLNYDKKFIIAILLQYLLLSENYTFPYGGLKFPNKIFVLILQLLTIFILSIDKVKLFVDEFGTLVCLITIGCQ